ncbi:MAG: SpoIIE family protein phosphatase [Opitutales bacterium]
MVGFLFGLVLGLVLAGLTVYWLRRRLAGLVEEKQLLEQERQIVLEFMHNMVEAMGEGVERQPLFERITHAAIQSTGALSACVFVYDDETKKLRGVSVEGLFPPHRPLPDSSKIKLITRAKYIEQVLKSEEFDIGEGIVGSVAQEGKGALVRDAMQDDRIHQHDDPALMVRSIIAVPIKFREELLGVLAVANPADGQAFNEIDFSLVENLAEQAGLAIHNADMMNLQIEKNRIDLDLSVASSIQSMLLPRSLPKHPGLDMAATYIPAQKVGGDLYDVFSLDDHRFGVAIADVSGKGVTGSILMAMTQTHLRHFARKLTSPAEVLTAMNHELMAQGMRRDLFVTMIYGIADLEENTITFARAGHELPLIVRTNPNNRRIETIQAPSEGMALGMVPTDVFGKVIGDKSMPFNDGDQLVLYTDGVTETANEDGTEYAIGRLADVVRTLRDRPALEQNQGILESLERFSGTSQHADDITILTVKRTPAKSG